jgi:hypothetical protein
MVYVVTAYCHDSGCWCYKRKRLVEAFTSEAKARAFIEENEHRSPFNYESLSFDEITLDGEK